jgi:hypothetical protein
MMINWLAKRNAIYTMSISIIVTISCAAPRDTLEKTTQESKENSAALYYHEPPNFVPSTALVGIVKFFEDRGDLNLYLPIATGPIFYFRDLPEVENYVHPGDIILQLEEKYESNFVRQRIEAPNLTQYEPTVRQYDRYDRKICFNDEDAIWLEMSQIVFIPERKEYGMFLRSVSIACMPIGGTRYWVSLCPEKDWEVVKIADLLVIEH